MFHLHSRFLSVVFPSVPMQFFRENNIMAKILIATEKPFAAAAREQILEIIKAGGMEPVLLEKYPDRAALEKAVADVEGLIIRSDKVDDDLLAKAPKLKIVVRAGAGTDNVTPGVKGKIVVENTPGQNSNAVAELAFGMAIMAARGFYTPGAGWELKDKILGLHAFGAVGKCMNRLAKGFGMKVLAFDPYLPKEAFAENEVEEITDIKELYKRCDIVSLHIPKTKKTIGSINAELLSLMKENALLINTSRKEVVNEDDLLKILAERPAFKFVCDVGFDKKVELPKDQFFCTPKKMGAQTSEANIGAGTAAARQAVAYLKDGTIMHQVK